MTEQTPSSADAGFVHCNLTDLPMEEAVAHGGRGLIRFHRILTGAAVEGRCNFIDCSVLPPGTSIGEHTHGPTEEEFYLVLAGHGVMRRDGETFFVRAGDLIRNRPGGTHALENPGPEELRLFVFELGTRG
jgi:mannose-6-phosphate isomerase-like protein (cupin superfamily)